MKWKKTLATMLVLTSLAGCKIKAYDPTETRFSFNQGKFYNAKAWEFNGGLVFRISEENPGGLPEIMVVARDIDEEYYDKNGKPKRAKDIRFDEIQLFAPKGNYLERFASIQEMGKAYIRYKSKFQDF